MNTEGRAGAGSAYVTCLHLQSLCGQSMPKIVFKTAFLGIQRPDRLGPLLLYALYLLGTPGVQLVQC